VYTKAVSGTNDPTLYQTERSGVIVRYNVPVTNGTYAVTLDFAEMYWNAAGKRIFDVTIEGQPVLQNFDIYAAAGGAQIALQRNATVTVSDGVLNIVGTASVDQAKFSAIEIVPSGP
jgi:Malectin domain